MRHDVRIVASNNRLEKHAFEGFCSAPAIMKKFSLESDAGLITVSTSNSQDLVKAFVDTLSERTKIVVVDEQTLGYIFPFRPNVCHVLRAMISKGSYDVDGSSFFTDGRTVRLANAATDENEFLVILSGYKNNPLDYEIN